jgi:hypothetical protein
LPSLSRKATEGDKLSAAEILKSLGLEVGGAGKSAEVWYIGASEHTEDEMEADMSVEATGTPSSGSTGGMTMQ